MSLQELNEKLHSREAHLDRPRMHTAYDPMPESGDAAAASEFKQPVGWDAPQAPTPEEMLAKEAKRRKRRKIAIILGSIAAIVLIGGIVFKVRSMLFAEERVDFGISGPQNVASAELVTYTFTYSNNNMVTLQNATLVLSYPDSFHPEADGKAQITGQQAEFSVGDIGRNTHGSVSISGKFYGSRGELDYLKAKLHYTPSNTSASFEKTAQFGVNLASSPLSFEISAPLEQATGQDVVYIVDYSNESGEAFSGLKVKMEYPDGFQFVSADPSPSEGNTVWYAGDVAGNTSKKITILGTLSGTRDEYKKVRGMIGFVQGDGTFVSYNVNERQTKIIASPLSIYQTVNGKTEVNVAPGNQLQYDVKYRNNGSVSVRDAIVTLELASSYLDFSRLTLPRGGTYDQARKMVVWKASDIPELARIDPGQGGTLSFTIFVKDISAIEGNEKNVSIRSQAMIDSPDVPTPVGSNKVIASNTLYVKLGSLVAVDIKGFRQDAALPNTGPIPPVVGKETTYTIHISLKNSSNDLTDSKVSVAFPTGIMYKKKSLPESETVTFNERTNELVWEVGTLSSDNKREISFQVGVIPGANQINQEIVLLNHTIFTAADSFTHQDVHIEKGIKSNNISEDPSVGTNNSRVVPAT